MIKIGRVHINLLMIPFLAVAYFTGSMVSTLIAYAVICLHESAHFLAAKRFAVKMDGLIVMPFGVSLQLKDNVIKNPMHEIGVCLAGPAMNFVLLLLGFVAKYNWFKSSFYLDFFLLSNFSIMLVNLLPILPLDGGRTLKALLTQHMGFVKAFRFTDIISKINIAMLGIVGLLILWVTQFNVSVAMLSAFLVFNIGSERQSNHLLVMRELLNYPKKLKEEGVMPVRELAVMGDVTSTSLLKNFSYNHFYIVRVMKDDIAIAGTLSETEILDAMMKLGSHVTLDQILQSQGKDKTLAVKSPLQAKVRRIV